MNNYVALLRAVNVGGTGKLAMTDLKAMCESAGFAQVQTYIASGNVLFRSPAPEREVKRALEDRLALHAGRRVGVLVRTASEMAQVLQANPFRDKDPSRTVALFLDQAPHAGMLTAVTGLDAEELRLGRREIYIHYPKGMGSTKLKVPAAQDGTARNMNTVAKLAELAAALGDNDRG